MLELILTKSILSIFDLLQYDSLGIILNLDFKLSVIQAISPNRLFKVSSMVDPLVISDIKSE